MFIKNGKVIAIGKVTTDNTTLSGTGLPDDPLQVIGGAGERGPKGDPGIGIERIDKTSTVGLVDTYTITFTNGTTQTFNVINGNDGSMGYTPVVSSKEASKTADHKNGGIEVTYIYPSDAKINPITYTIWHGNDADADIAGLSATISNEYAKKSEIPTVPTAVSELENDKGYITTAAVTGTDQYAMTTEGWKPVEGGGGGDYLPLTGGTVDVSTGDGRLRYKMSNNYDATSFVIQRGNNEITFGVSNAGGCVMKAASLNSQLVVNDVGIQYSKTNGGEGSYYAAMSLNESPIKIVTTAELPETTDDNTLYFVLE